jgi:hypothetical protein
VGRRSAAVAALLVAVARPEALLAARRAQPLELR